MTAPEAHAALAAALAAVQAELPEVKKTRTADVNNKDGRYLYSYSYADLADASAAILPVLGKHGLAFTAFPGHQPDGKFGLRYWLLHSGGGSIEGFFEIADQGGMQMIGGRITYARRYCLCAVTGIAAEDDADARDDGSSNGRRAQRRQQPAAGRGEQAPQHTAQRRASTPAARPTPADSGLPPLPGEEDPTTSGASSSAAPDPSPTGTGERSPSTPDGSAPGDPVSNKRLTAIWTTLTKDFEVTSDDGGREEARAACGIISGRGAGLPSTKKLTNSDASTVLDTLAHLKAQAAQLDESPRMLLIALLAEREEGASDGE